MERKVRGRPRPPQIGRSRANDAPAQSQLLNDESSIDGRDCHLYIILLYKAQAMFYLLCKYL